MDKLIINMFNKIQRDFYNSASKAETSAKLDVLVEVITYLTNNLTSLGQVMILYGVLDDINVFREEMEEY